MDFHYYALLSPYVVYYRAEHLWSTWTENGPEGTQYNRSNSGWFDAVCFEDCFQSTFLPAVKNLDGSKVIIGDNLFSHISLHVLKLCENNNIRFVCLPPNSTHLTQPLDVAFFAPMKRLWRDILRKWKESDSGSKFATIPKDLFPRLLKELMSRLEKKQRDNLTAGFAKCGIHPLNKQRLLDRLPENQPVDKESIGEAFVEQLEKKRAEFLTKDGPRRKKMKLQVPAGKSITFQEVEAANKPSTSASKKTQKVSKKKNKKRHNSSSDEDDVEMVLESDGQSETFSDLEEILREVAGISVYRPNDEKTPVELKPEDFAIDNFVVVTYNGEKYPGKIVRLSEEGPSVECMEKRVKFWRWPEKQDCLTYDWEDVYQKINPPKIVSKRNQFHVPVPELDN